MAILVCQLIDGRITFYVAGQSCAGVPVKHHPDSDRGSGEAQHCGTSPVISIYRLGG